MTVRDLDVAAAADAAAELVPCCSSRRWVSTMVKRRPYANLERLKAVSNVVISQLDWVDLEEALESQPRMGASAASDLNRDELFDAHLAYEQRFGHTLLICTVGLSAHEALAAMRSRLHNDPIAEREIVRGELTKIVRMRLAQAFR